MIQYPFGLTAATAWFEFGRLFTGECVMGSAIDLVSERSREVQTVSALPTSHRSTPSMPGCLLFMLTRLLLNGVRLSCPETVDARLGGTYFS